MGFALDRTEFFGNAMHAANAVFGILLPHITETIEEPASATPESLRNANELFDKLLSWEQGQLSEPETLTFFQALVASGLAWKSTGAVRRTAALLIRDGRIQAGPCR
jgi:hypothetical protein